MQRDGGLLVELFKGLLEKITDVLLCSAPVRNLLHKVANPAALRNEFAAILFILDGILTRIVCHIGSLEDDEIGRAHV